jgi:hypothetical protein
MRLDKLLCLGIHVRYIAFEYLTFHPPLSSTTNFDGGQFTIAHKGISLGRGNIESFGDISQGKKSHELMVPNESRSSSTTSTAVDNRFSFLGG